MHTYLAYQPIVNQRRQVVGYELFYRDGSGNFARIRDPDRATRKVVTDAFTLFNLQNETSGFFLIHFTPNLLLDNFVLNADPDRVIIQLSGNVQINEETEAKILSLRDAGYAFALKNYAIQRHLHQYLPLFDIIRVNFKDANSLLQKEIVRKYGRPGTVFMADRLETEDDFYNANKLGYTLFQGYFYAKPLRLWQELPPLKDTPYGEILQTLLHIVPEEQWESHCARVIQSDMTFSYLFPRETKAMPFPPDERTYQEHLDSVIYRMGPHTLLHWVCLLLMRQRNTCEDEDLLHLAYRRGLFMETLAMRSTLDADWQSGSVFFVGAFSMIKQVTGDSPQFLLQGMDLPAPVWEALLDAAQVGNDYARLLRYAAQYETDSADLTPDDIQTAFNDVEIERLFRKCLTDADAAIVRMDTRV